MEQRVDVSAQVARGEKLLLAGQAREAAVEFSEAARADGEAVRAHLGLAEASLAMGDLPVTAVATQHVRGLAPGSAEASLALAIELAMQGRYEATLTALDEVVSAEPGNAYAHALRGVSLRRLGNSYDASLAEAKSARLSSNRNLGELLQRLPQVGAAGATNGAAGKYSQSASYATNVANAAHATNTANAASAAAQRSWDQRSQVERQAVRARFALRFTPIVTYMLVVINVVVYVACSVLSRDFITPVNGYANNPIYQFGIEQGALMQHDPIQYYRVLTAMFLHESILHIGLNMFSLFSVGIVTERIFGRGGFLAIYFLGGIAGGLAQAFLTPDVAALGASGAIFAIFGAFGAFALLKRRALGPAGNSVLGQWVFFLALNLVFSFTAPGIGLYDHLGGLILGFILGAIFIAQMDSRRARRA